jgi:putative MATE family efflux protein
MRNVRPVEVHCSHPDIFDRRSNILLKVDVMLQNTPVMQRFRDTFIGDKKFYRAVLTLVMPLVAQNLLSNFVNLLDNVMIGHVGTMQMSGVAIANQLLFVFMLTIFGATSGAGIYGAQYCGAKDWEGLRQTLRFKLLTALAFSAAGIVVLAVWDKPLISLYLTGEGSPADAAAMLGYGRQYLRIMLFGLLPFAFTMSYSSTLRESGNTTLPMIASMSAVLVNLTFNYLLIYGKLGFPKLGVEGAAIATVLSRFVELGIVAGRAHANYQKYFFLKGVYRHFHIQRKLAGNIAFKTLPLLINELFWSLSVTALTQIFSTCGLMVVAGLNIASTITNLFSVFFISMGGAVAVMVGQALGAADIPQARRYTWKLTFFSVSICVVLGSALALSAEAIPGIYNAGPDVRHLAAVFMRTGALYMGFNAITHCCYFAMRSGGKTIIPLLFDSVFSWVVCVPYAYLLVHYSGLAIEALYPLCYLSDAFKCIAGIIIVRTGAWANNMVSANHVLPAGLSQSSASD